MPKTFDQELNDMGLELTARDVLTEDELAEDWRERHLSPDRLAYKQERDLGE
jgi:hypothetical protein